MSEWKECKLGDIIAFGNGKVRPITLGDIPIYGGNGILGYGNAHNYSGETLIIGRVGAYCGSVYYESKYVWVSDNALAGKPKNGNNAKFLYYYLCYLRLNEFAEGSSHPLITQTLLNSIDVRITNVIEEQERIAGVLSSLDDKIDLLNRQNSTLESLAETVFCDAFLMERSEQWKKRPLSSICIMRNEKIAYTEIDLDNYISTENMLNNKKGVKIATSIPAMGGATRYYANDILISNIRPYFKKIWFADKCGSCSNDVLAFTSSVDEISNYFLYYLLRQDSFFDYMILGSKGCKMPRGDKDHIMNLEIKIPDEETMSKFNVFAEMVIGKMSCNNREIRVLSKLRDMLLPKLMSNEIDILP